MASSTATVLMSQKGHGIMSKDDPFQVHCGCRVESEKPLNFYSPGREVRSQ
jgi:hypothetical protein